MNAPTKVSRLLHAGFLFHSYGTRIAFDPIFENPFSRNCYAFPDVEFDTGLIAALDLQAVFISHYHDDHCSLESLALLHREIPVYIFCVHEELPAMIRQLGFRRIETLTVGQTVHVGGFAVRVHPALDRDVDSIFQIQVEGLNILNVVDAWIGDDTLEHLAREKWDLILWPFQTMRELEVLSPRRASLKVEAPLPPEWLIQLKRLAPDFLVPSSCQFQMEPWSWYNRFFFPVSYARFTAEMARELPHARVVRMDPGSSFVLKSGEFTAAEALPWIRRTHTETVDYSVDNALIPPSTSEVARRFPPLSVEDAADVADFCTRRLPTMMVAPTDPYFYKKRNWRLAVYDHTGRAAAYNYTIEEEAVTPVKELGGPCEWLTEIPAYKLYGALNHGESLSSLYLRINDIEFNPETEKRIVSADVLEDPLIRVLFQGDRFAYQADQLRRLEEKARGPKGKPSR